jgi:DnaJ-class molecular chaperone
MAIKTCPTCKGTTEYKGTKCQTCQGSGEVEEATKEEKKALTKRTQKKGKK